MNLSEFLLARIAEDERAARAAADRIPLMYHPDVLRVDYGLGIAQSQHIARWDPARVLAECEAKRRIVAHYLGSGDALSKYTDPLKRMVGEAIHESHGDALKPLALPYADHPDYDQSWRP